MHETPLKPIFAYDHFILYQENLQKRFQVFSASLQMKRLGRYLEIVEE